MAISQAMATSFKVQLLAGDFDFATGTSQTFYCALYTSSATLGATTTAYTASNEVSGTGYSATGKQLTVSQVPTSTGTTAFLDFSNPMFFCTPIINLIYIYKIFSVHTHTNLLYYYLP